MDDVRRVSAKNLLLFYNNSKNFAYALNVLRILSLIQFCLLHKHFMTNKRKMSREYWSGHGLTSLTSSSTPVITSA